MLWSVWLANQGKRSKDFFRPIKAKQLADWLAIVDDPSVFRFKIRLGSSVVHFVFLRRFHKEISHIKMDNDKSTMLAVLQLLKKYNLKVS